MTERRGYKPYSNEERQAIKDDVFAKLEAGVAAITDSEAFTRYLTAQAKFPRYSPNNVILILQQYPDATIVNSFRRWSTDFERRVKKGEKSIRILAPTFGKDEETGEQKLKGFIPVPVFDVSQTEGKPLPEPEKPLLLEGENGGQLFDALLDWGNSERVRARLSRNRLELGGANGDYNPRTREIRLRPNPMRQMAKTLAHELGHHVHLSYIGAESTDRGEKETVAEGVAFVVTQHFGIDSGEYSFPYIAGWAGDKARLVQKLGVIQQVSSRIIDGVAVVAGVAAEPPTAELGKVLPPQAEVRFRQVVRNSAGHTRPRLQQGL